MSDRGTWRVGTAYSFTVVLFDEDDNPVTGAAGALETQLALEDALSSQTVTVSEIDSGNFPGWYSVTFTPNAFGHWACRVWHPTHNLRGWLDEIEVGDSSAVVPLGWVTGSVNDAAPAATSFISDLPGTSTLNYLNWFLVWTSGINAFCGFNAPGGYSATVIGAFDPGTKQITMAAGYPVGTPSKGDTFVLIPAGIAILNEDSLGTISVYPSKGVVETAVWAAPRAGSWGAGSLGAGLAGLALLDGTCPSGSTTTTIVLDSNASSVTDYYKNAIVTLTGGTGVGQARVITAYNGATKTATVNVAWKTNPAAGFAPTTYTVLAAGVEGVDWGQINNPTTAVDLSNTTIKGLDTSVTVSGTPSVNVTQWKGSTPGNLSAVGNVPADVEEWRASVPNALQAGRVDGYLGAVAAGVIAAASFAAGALAAVWDELTSGHVVASTFGKLLGLFSFSGAGNVKADVEEWKAAVPAALDLGGNVQVDVVAWQTHATNALSNGCVQVDVEQWRTASPNPLSAAGNVPGDLEQWKATTPNALIGGRVDAVAGVVSDKTGYSLTAAEENAIADAILKRDLSNVEASAGQHTLAGGLQKLNCKVALSPDGTLLTIYRSDGTTVAYTQATTTDPNAAPVTSVS